MTIAQDSVDDELLSKPRRWNIRFIRQFMLVFGLLSSVFDFVTFGVLIWLLKADEATFRTCWFVESVISASLIVLVVRTRRVLWKSRPSRLLTGATIAVVGMALLLPLSPLGPLLALVVPPTSFLFALMGIVACYVITAEVAKKIFYRWMVFY